MGNCRSNEYCERCGEDIDNEGFVRVEHNDFCSMDVRIQNLVKELNESRNKNSSIVRKGQTVLACSDMAQRRIKVLETQSTGLKSEIQTLKTQLQGLKQQLNDSKEENRSLKILKTQTTELDNEIISLKTQLQNLAQELNESKEENHSLKLLNSSLKQLLSKRKLKIAQQEEVKSWRANWPKAAQVRIQNLEAEIVGLKSENTSLKASLNTNNLYGSSTHNLDAEIAALKSENTLKASMEKSNSYIVPVKRYPIIQEKGFEFEFEPSFKAKTSDK